ncbi:invasion associated locus B family protein (plasmid) [Ensifer sp. PDNC004]|uniref:invasion associated locus B family protein n=1 Tax=Ensifer sp. PDNC004 TaxID=2811423 RepID=UPI0019630A37|nr:invasion associated locus B family protein [Ensifer sp. PDNC004]QRY64871.1 invasion associated locus B family protein [Ensifer sp. PDNC004]
MKRKTSLTMISATAALVLFGLSLMPASAEDKSPVAGLPGGASSLQESYGDWSVACRIIDNTRQCAASQQQMQQSGQRVLAIEVRDGKAGALEATLVLPFGLLLDAGITLAVDEEKPGEALRFSTCIPAGCLVPATFDAAMLERLRTGKVLKLGGTSADGQMTPLSVSLNGFAAASDRLKALIAS